MILDGFRSGPSLLLQHELHVEMFLLIDGGRALD